MALIEGNELSTLKGKARTNTKPIKPPPVPVSFIKKAKWILKVEYSSREDMIDYLADDEDEDMYAFDKYNEVEISVVREDNKLGLESAGWDDENKITLFSCDSGIEASNDKEADEIIKWWKEVANTIADALNKKGL